MSKIFDEYAEARLKKSGRPTAAERIDAWLARGKIGQQQQHQQQQAGTGAGELTTYLFIAMDDDHGAHLTYCKDRDAVTSAVGAAMYMPYDAGDADQAEIVSAHVDTLLEDGAVTFEGDPPLYLYRIASSIAAQSGQRAGVADGWQLVPVEPTDAMMEAAQAEWMKGCADPTMHVWDAMLAAAQGVQHG